MPEWILLGATLDLTAPALSGAMIADVNAADPANPGWLVDVDGDDDAIAAATSRSRVDRWALQLDLGAGLQTIAPREFAVISIDGSLDEWADRCALELYGAKYSPQVTGALRGLVAVVVTETIGEPSRPVTREQFRGAMLSAPYDGAARTLRATALDDAARYAETNIAPYLEPASGKTRDGYALELMAAAGITVGSLDTGPLGATEITKPVSKVDVLLFDFLRDWYACCGAWIEASGGRVSIVRYSPDVPVAAELRPNDCVTVPQFTPPPALAPNKITAVTVNFERIESDGTRTISFSEITYENYAIKGAVAKQDKTTGTISVVSYGDAVAALRIVAQTNYVQQFRGNIMVASETIEFEWRARRIARMVVGTDGVTVTHLTAQDCYQYADGNWYADMRESYVPVRRQTTTKTLAATFVDENGETAYQVVQAVENLWESYFVERALYRLTGSPPVQTFDSASPIAMTDSDDGVDPAAVVDIGYGFAYSFPPMQRVTRTTAIDGEGYTTSETESIETYNAGARATSAAAGSYVYGFAAGKRYYVNQSFALREASRRETLNVKYNDDYWISYENERTFETNKLVSKSPQEHTGQRPRAEQLQAESRSQELRQSVTDEVREFFAGKTIESYIQNEYCQNDADLLGLANAVLRKESAWRGAVVLPHSHVLRKGHYVDLIGWTSYGLPVDPMRCLVTGAHIDCAAKTKTLDLEYSPPEVA